MQGRALLSMPFLQLESAVPRSAGVWMGQRYRGNVYNNPPSFGNDERGDAKAQMAPAARNKLSMCTLK